MSPDMPLAQMSIKITLEGSQNTCILIKSLSLCGFSGNVKSFSWLVHWCFGGEDMYVQISI